MAYIPQDAAWYITELVIEILVEEDPRNIVHRNLILIHAHSPDEAFSRANEIGQQHQREYQNPGGRLVRLRFRGISRLNVIHEPIEDGAEIIYTEQVGVSETEIQRMIPARDCLSVFRPIESSAGPDYSSNEICEEARRLASETTNKTNGK